VLLVWCYKSKYESKHDVRVVPVKVHENQYLTEIIPRVMKFSVNAQTSAAIKSFMS